MTQFGRIVVVLSVAALGTVNSTVARAQHRNCKCQACSTSSYAAGPKYGAAPVSPVAPDGSGDPSGLPDPLAGGDAAAPALLASEGGAAAAPNSVAPNMLGDTSISQQLGVNSLGNGLLSSGQHALSGGGGNITRFKIAENSNPLPQDRLFFNYNHFHGAGSHNNGSDADIDTYTFGVEKALMCGMFSVELRVPFTSGFGADQIEGLRDTSAEFGNLGLGLKALVYENDCTILSGGLTLSLPTGPDATLRAAPAGPVLVTVDNTAVHVSPFLALLRRPSENLFVQTYLQFDWNTGNDFVDTDTGGAASGTVYDADLLFLDLQVGYWLYRDPCSCGFITGIAPIAELHYTTTIDDATAGPISVAGVGYQTSSVDVLNLTGAVHLELASGNALRIATVVPLDDDERFFDAEVSVQFNYRR